MGYVIGEREGEAWTWYLELRQETGWKPSKVVGITDREMEFYLGKCFGHTKGECPTRETDEAVGAEGGGRPPC